MADIGATLHEARMRAGIDMTEVERRTKIRAKYLRAIENEEWDLLPGPIYAKSFLRTYGDFLGLDSRMLVDEFRRRYERPSEQELRPLSTISRERERARRGPLLPAWSIVGLVLVAVLGLLYLLGQGGTAKAPTGYAPVRTPTAPRKPAPVAPVRRRHHAAPSQVTLSLTPTGTVYVCLVDAAGHKLINQQTFSAGTPIPPQRSGKLLLTLGNASVTMKVQGRSVPVPASASAIRYLLAPGVVRRIPLSTAPKCP